jgi:hypothetical protein
MMMNVSTSLSKQQIVEIIVLLVAAIAYYYAFRKAPAKATGKLAEKAEVNGGSNALQLQQYVDASGEYYSPTGYGYLHDLYLGLVPPAT